MSLILTGRFHMLRVADRLAKAWHRPYHVPEIYLLVLGVVQDIRSAYLWLYL